MPAPVPKRRFATMVAVLAAVIAIPLVVGATNRFDDVPNSNVHHDNITWLADVGVTVGCNPPANDEYCPDDSVSRAQMATFMRRLAENQVVDAATVEGQNSNALKTLVWAESCGVSASPGPVIESSCLPSSGGMIGAESATEVFRVPLSAPTGGSLQLSSTALTGEHIVWTFTLNQTCAADIETLINRAVNGHLWSSNADTVTVVGNAHITANIPSGNHTVRLCGLNQAIAPVALQTGSITAEWNAGGTVSVTGGETSVVDMTGLLGG